MAVTKDELSVLERQWVKLSLVTQKNALLRARQKEMPGSPIWVMRGEEIAQVESLVVKFS